MSGSTTPHPPLAHRLGADRWRRRGGPERVTDYSRLLLGLVIVAIGVLFLLDATGSIDASNAIDRWWPLVFVAAGAFTAAERPPALFRAAVLTGIGVVLLLFSTDVLADSDWAFVWPALVVLLGLLIVARWSGRPAIAPSAAEGEIVRATTVFGGPKLASADQHFRGAWLTAVFGGVSLDLRGARPAPEGATINATTAFGGVDVLVPHGWRISVRSTPIFGGVEDKTDHSEPPPPDAPTLYVDAICIFGGVKVTHGK